MLIGVSAQHFRPHLNVEGRFLPELRKQIPRHPAVSPVSYPRFFGK